MRVRRTMCGLLLPSALWMGMGCNALGSRNTASAARTAAGPSPSIQSSTGVVTNPGAGAGTPSATPVGTTRSQQPEQPGVLTLPPAKIGDEVRVRVVAYVNNYPIFDSEVREAVLFHMRELEGLSEEDRERKLKQLRVDELDKLIEREVVVSKVTKLLSDKKAPPKAMEELKKEAAKQFEGRIKEIKKQYKLASDEQLQQFFSSSGMSIDNYRRNIERNFISGTYVRQMIMPKLDRLPLSEIHDYYLRHQEDYAIKDHVKWQDIFLDASRFSDRAAARNSAMQVESELRSGADFAKSAEQLRQAGFNILPGDSGVGEKLGEIKPAELESAVFSLSPGQIGGPIEVAGGYHIFKVVERTKAGVKPFEDSETQRDIGEKLKNLLFQKEYQRLVDELKGEAVIQKLE
jgi:hypothetical protein